jgi:uncharacterized membrane protein (UPF0182 family)
MRPLRALLVFLIAAFAVVLVTPTLAELLTDWYWFRELGFESVFLTRLTTQLALGLGLAAVAFVFLFVNLRLAQRGVAPDRVVVRLGESHAGADLLQLLRRASWLVALVMAFPIGLAGASGWTTLLRFLHRTPFGTADPAFGRDVGYYVFTLPLISSGLSVLLALTLLSLGMVVPLYLLRRDIVALGTRIRIEPSAQWHLAVLIALLFVTWAADAWLIELPSLVYSTRGPLVGASYTDLAISATALRITALVGLAAAGLVLWGGRQRALVRFVAIAAVAYGGAVLVGAGAAAAMQRFVVGPNELVRETPQIEDHIEATRRAWGLDDVIVRDLSGGAQLTLEDIRENQGTIRNVRLWDRDQLLQTFGQLQEIRTYYDFINVDDDRYWIDGVYRQVLLSPRELNSAALPARSFINERLTYTHGMGLTLSPVNEVTAEGLPVLFLENLPPVSHVSLAITEPAMYYGELSSDYVFVNTGQREFDYPAGDEIAFTTYDGTGGVRVGSVLRKALFAIRFGSLKVLLSNDITAESRALFRRAVGPRVRTALPFLDLDSDPYMVIREDGRLVWVLDAYTASSRYPYSQPASDGTNYMRNSVKIVVDAYHGTVTPYVADPSDPIVQTYEKIFAGIFQPLDSMPADLRAHLRYPDDLFRIQTALYTTFHMRRPETFYHREDQWQIPAASPGQGATRDPFLRHIVMKLPGQAQEEFIVMTPFTPRQKDNLAAWMVARMDGDAYGELVVYRFPRQSLVFGPSQVVNRMNQDTEISQQISLWDQRGTRVIRGNLLVIPIQESLLYVQAIYLQAEGGRIPELKRVIVAHENEVVMALTLDHGLALLFGGTVGPERQPAARIADAVAQAGGVPPTQAERVRDLISDATSEYERATQAQRNDDWATYGQAMRRVGELLQELRQLVGGSED